MLGTKSPLYYSMISNPVTSSYGVKILLSDVVYSSAICMNIYFNTENEGTTGNAVFSILMSGMIACSTLDFSTNIFSNALLAINSFASTHMMLNTIKDSGMHAIQGLTNYFASEEQTDFA